MNSSFASSLAQAIQYLLLFFSGTSFNTLHERFSNADQKAYEEYQQKREKLQFSKQETYDFIIVGGGSAGSVLANRLTEENFTVLLLEAGGNPFPITNIPILAPLMLNHPNIDWGDHIIPQKKACQALKNNGSTFNRGKVLGGGSTLNYLVYMRGNPNDFDNWAEETGDSSWRYKDVLPYFKKIEDYHGKYPNPDYHSSGGPLHINPNNYAPLVDEWLKAGQELNFPIKDPNANHSQSFFPFDISTKNGTRFSTYRAYILPALNRPNLMIRIYSHATKIEFDSKNKATGVYYVYKGKEHFAHVKKEVILSAGTLGSPQILMLSGIGPEKDLKELGIPVRVNLPVGKNFQDHVISTVGPFLIDDEKSFNPAKHLNPTTLLEYTKNGTGPFSSLSFTAGASVATSRRDPSWPDMLLTFFSLSISEKSLAGLQHAHGFRPEILRKYFKSDYGRDAFFIVTTVVRPESRGEVKLKSSDPFDKLIIDPMYFSHPYDMDAMLEGVKFAISVGNDTDVFKKIGSKLTSSVFPGCEEFAFARNDEYWKCHIRHWSTTMWHWTSTCRMGKEKDDPNAVVDSSLRVLGTSNLRVIDGSIMPKVTSANTNAPTIMIGEKGADMIKQFWKSQKSR